MFVKFFKFSIFQFFFIPTFTVPHIICVSLNPRKTHTAVAKGHKKKRNFTEAVVKLKAYIIVDTSGLLYGALVHSQSVGS